MTAIAELPTPALLLDLDRLDANIRTMADRARTLGVRLRPHLKTHKCVEVARRQREAGAEGVTVATLAEARIFADHGFDDITWAFPLPLSRLDEARNVAERITLRIVVDSWEAVDALEKLGFGFHVWLKIDCGYHRAGVPPDAPDTLALARALAASRHLTFDGILSHSGHAYTPDGRDAIRAVAEQERRAMADLRDRLDTEGIAAEVSVGSTPAMAVAEHLDGVTEARPGNYVFYDATQAAFRTCGPTDVALSVLTSVVSNPPGASHCVCDAGALALSKDAGLPHGTAGMGGIWEDYDAGQLREDIHVEKVSQEHGILSASLPVGERVRIVPNHSCLTAACWDEYHVVRGDEVVDRWRIHRVR